MLDGRAWRTLKAQVAGPHAPQAPVPGRSAPHFRGPASLRAAAVVRRQPSEVPHVTARRPRVRTAGGGGERDQSSLRTAATAVPWSIVACDGRASRTRKYSSRSWVRSPRTWTVTVFDVWPGAKETVPEAPR